MCVELATQIILYIQIITHINIYMYTYLHYTCIGIYIESHILITYIERYDRLGYRQSSQLLQMCPPRSPHDEGACGKVDDAPSTEGRRVDRWRASGTTAQMIAAI